MHRAISRLLRLFGFRRTFGGAVVRVQRKEIDNLTSFPPISDKEAEEIKGRHA